MNHTIYGNLRKAYKMYPDKIVYEDEDGTITYSELYKNAMYIAQTISVLGRKKRPILIVSDASVRCAVMAYGVVCSGNFYTIVNPHNTKEKLSEIMNVFEPEIVFTCDRFVSYVNQYNRSGIKVLTLENCIRGKNSFDDIIIESIQPNDPAFVIFTSGSTGVPKGVVISHQNVLNFKDAYVEYIEASENTRIAETNANMFVIFSLHIFTTVAIGGMQYIMSSEDMFLSRYLKRVSEKRLNSMFCISTVLTLSVNHDVLEEWDISCLKKIMFIGQAISSKHLNKWRSILPDSVFISAYGSTESLLPMIHVIETDYNDSVPIGSSWKNIEPIVLNEEGKVVQNQECGELYIRSDRNALGYYKDSNKTSENFIQNPLHNDYIDYVYKTGDIVHFDEFGRLFYDGRNDSMVKRRGYRIELGEIEKKAMQHESIKEAACIYLNDRDIIVLFYEGDMEERACMDMLSQLLYVYTLPDKIMRVEKMPHNANSKIDRLLLKTLVNKSVENI